MDKILQSAKIQKVEEKMHRSGYKVKYREMCYTCGSVRNIYFDNGRWQCKSCWDYEKKLVNS